MLIDFFRESLILSCVKLDKRNFTRSL